MMFWRFGYHAPSAIDSILDQPNVDLEKIFAEDDLVQECKSQNRKLVDFLNRQENIEKLIHYALSGSPTAELIVEAGELDNAENLESRKYAYLAAEVISCEIFSILESLGEAQYLEYIFNFLGTEFSKNALLLNHFNKITQVLFQRIPQEVFAYLSTKATFVDDLLGSIEHMAIVEVIVRLANSPDNAGIEILTKSDFGGKIFQLFSTTTNEEVLSNLTSVLVDMIRCSNSGLLSTNFVASLFTEANLSAIFSRTFNPDDASASRYGASILNEFVNVFGGNQLSIQPNPFSAYTNVFKQHAANVSSFLVRDGQQEVPFTFGRIAPLGTSRLLLAELILKTLRSFPNDLQPTFVEHHFVKALIDLFFKFPFNSLLHGIVYEVILVIVKGQLADFYPELFAESGFIKKTIEVYPDTHIHEIGASSHRLGYCGYLTKIANLIEESKATFQTYLGSDWTTFVSAKLQKQNNVEKPPSHDESNESHHFDRHLDDDDDEHDDFNDRDDLDEESAAEGIAEGEEMAIGTQGAGDAFDRDGNDDEDEDVEDDDEDDEDEDDQEHGRKGETQPSTRFEDADDNDEVVVDSDQQTPAKETEPSQEQSQSQSQSQQQAQEGEEEKVAEAESTQEAAGSEAMAEDTSAASVSQAGESQEEAASSSSS